MVPAMVASRSAGTGSGWTRAWGGLEEDASVWSRGGSSKDLISPGPCQLKGGWERHPRWWAQ